MRRKASAKSLLSTACLVDRIHTPPPPSTSLHKKDGKMGNSSMRGRRTLAMSSQEEAICFSWPAAVFLVFENSERQSRKQTCSSRVPS